MTEKEIVKVYIAGKVNPSSPHVDGLYWRDGLCEELSEKTGYNIMPLDPVKSNNDFDFNQVDEFLITGRNGYMIKKSNLVIVNLTDDISVGGSTEILVAKYMHRPVIGYAQPNGKFIRDEKEIQGRVYHHFVNPYINAYCDFIAINTDQVAAHIKTIMTDKPYVKDMSVIPNAIDYYLEKFYQQDSYLLDLIGR